MGWMTIKHIPCLDPRHIKKNERERENKITQLKCLVLNVLNVWVAEIKQTGILQYLIASNSLVTLKRQIVVIQWPFLVWLFAYNHLLDHLCLSGDFGCTTVFGSISLEGSSSVDIHGSWKKCVWVGLLRVCVERTFLKLSYIMGGCQMVGISMPPFFQRQEPSEDAIRHVLQQVKARVDQLTGKETVNLVWAFSKMQAGAVGCLGFAWIVTWLVAWLEAFNLHKHKGLWRTECGWPHWCVGTFVRN